MAQSSSVPLRYLGRGRPWPVSSSSHSNKLTSYFYHSNFFSDELTFKITQFTQLNEDYHRDTLTVALVRVSPLGPSSRLRFSVYFYSPFFRRFPRYLLFLLRFFFNTKPKFVPFFRRQLSTYSLISKRFVFGSNFLNYFFFPCGSFGSINFFFSYLAFYYRWISFFSVSVHLRRLYRLFFPPGVLVNFVLLRRYWVSSNIVSHRAAIFLTLRFYFRRIFSKFKNLFRTSLGRRLRTSGTSSRFLRRRVLPRSHVNSFFPPPSPPYDFFRRKKYFSKFPYFYSFLSLFSPSFFSFLPRPLSAKKLSFSSLFFLKCFRRKVFFRYSRRPSFSSLISEKSISAIYFEGFRRLSFSGFYGDTGLLGFCFHARGRFSKRLMAEHNRFSYGPLGLSKPHSSTADFVLKTPHLRNGVCGLSGFICASSRLCY